MLKIKENIYGHKNRLNWIKKNISKEQKGLEFGCGTGVMITGVLLQEGYNTQGIDLDKDSITLGQTIYQDNGFETNRLICDDIKNLPNESYDYIIASEVFEHIPNPLLDEVIALVKQKIKPNGLLLVTVPNGYGWFELEDFIWKKLKVGSVLQFFKINSVINKVKQIFTGKYIDCEYPSSIADSPHVQKFTLNSISKKVGDENFSILDFRGSTMFAGPFSNMFFTGFKSLMDLNIYLGAKFPNISSGFYIAFKKN